MKSFFLAAALTLAGAGASLAQPVPRAFSPEAPQVAPSRLIQQVDYACGPGWRLNRWGDCVPRRGPPPRRYYRPPPPDWGWGPPPPRYRPPPHYSHWGPPRGDWGPPPRW
ncbi:GCG_CRPN prefix-to-repeats domain-containing protein [Rhizobium sp. SGZ-381]|uniref:GCG_CRPN prefix-to-repeats domain-containing protein n=1 Tax=Rhizobium sp. SGZ-381 TaxID=3342800 RepID=UPI00366D2EB1